MGRLKASRLKPGTILTFDDIEAGERGRGTVVETTPQGGILVALDWIHRYSGKLLNLHFPKDGPTRWVGYWTVHNILKGSRA